MTPNGSGIYEGRD